MIEVERAKVQLAVALTMHVGSAFMQEYDGIPDGTLVMPDEAREFMDSVLSDENTRLAYLWYWTDKGQFEYSSEIAEKFGKTADETPILQLDAFEAMQHFEGARGLVSRLIASMFESNDILFDDSHANSVAQQSYAILALLSNEWEAGLPCLLVNRDKNPLMKQLFDLTIEDTRNVCLKLTEAFQKQTVTDLLSGTPLSL